MRITNLSSEPERVLRSWLPHELNAEHVVFFPDACPGRSALPTGTVIFTKQLDWRRFAVSDCGCGMRLLKSSMKSGNLTQGLWDEVAMALKRNKGKLGDLGGGNHFMDALLPNNEDNLWFLIHTGSRKESGIVDDLVNRSSDFDKEFERVVTWAKSNRAKVQESLENIIGKTELILDLPHNTFEKIKEGTIIRKGSVKLMPGEISILPSHISGDASLIMAMEEVSEIMFSMSHGTGRKMSRHDAKQASVDFDLSLLRQKILMPSFLNDSSLGSEGPHAYRDLDDCLKLIAGFVEEIKRFSVIAYMGHL